MATAFPTLQDSLTGPVATDRLISPRHSVQHSTWVSALPLIEGLLLGPVYFNVRDSQFAGGAKGDNITDDTAAIQACIDAAWAFGTGAVVIIPPGIYLIKSPGLILKRSQVRGLKIIGAGPYATQLNGSVFLGANAIFQWDMVNSGSIRNQEICGMRLARSDSGSLITHDQVSAGNDRITAQFNDLILAQIAAGTGTLAKITGSLKSSWRNVLFGGGTTNGLCIYLINSSQDVFWSPYGFSNVGRFCHISGGGDHVFFAPRSESQSSGGPCDYMWFFDNTTGNTLVHPQGEGKTEAIIYRYDNAQGVMLINPEVPIPENATDPSGCVFRNGSIGNYMIGGICDRFSAFGAGKTFDFDATSGQNVVNGMRISSANSDTDLTDLNGDNDLTLLNLLNTPPVWRMYGKRWARQYMTRGSSPQFGAVDNQTVSLMANNAAVAEFSSGGFKIKGNAGFYDTAPIAKQVGVPITAAGIHAALVALGLIGV